jgi:DegV family protein with EDD domain
MKIKIVTDSSCDLPEEILKQYDLEMVPLHVTFENNETFLDRVSITPEQFWKRLARDKELPKTSRPAPEAFAGVFKEALTHYTSVIYIGISSALSGTFESAQLAAKSVPGDIHLIDSLTGSLGLGILTVKAHGFIHSGMNVQTAVQKIIAYRDGMNTIFTMDSLENLIKGGRVGKLPGFVGSVLDIKPIGKAGNIGQIDVIEKVRGRKKALRRLVQLIGEKGTNLHEKIIGISHLDCWDEILKLKEHIEQKFHPQQVILSGTGSTMGTYAGKGGIIISF